MIRLLIFILVFLGILLVFNVLRDIFLPHRKNPKKKLILAVIFGICVILAVILSIFQSRDDANILELSRHFLAGKSLNCRADSKNFIVTRENFSFSSGTLTLVGKRNTEFADVILDLKSCKIL